MAGYDRKYQKLIDDRFMSEDSACALTSYETLTGDKITFSDTEFSSFKNSGTPPAPQSPGGNPPWLSNVQGWKISTYSWQSGISPNDSIVFVSPTYDRLKHGMELHLPTSEVQEFHYDETGGNDFMTLRDGEIIRATRVDASGVRRPAQAPQASPLATALSKYARKCDVPVG